MGNHTVWKWTTVLNIVVRVLFVLEVDIQRVLLQSELCTQYIYISIKYMFLGNGIGIFLVHEEGIS